MFLPESVKIFLASEPADMRKSHDGLSALVRQQFTETVLSGHLFVFYNKKRNRVKVLFYDRGGLCLFYKRLPKGRFQLPDFKQQGPVRLSGADLNLILAGFDPRQLKPQKLWLPREQSRIGDRQKAHNQIQRRSWDHQTTRTTAIGRTTRNI